MTNSEIAISDTALPVLRVQNSGGRFHKDSSQTHFIKIICCLYQSQNHRVV